MNTATNDTTCNGWTNYATWRINMELCSDMIDSMAEDIEGGHRDAFDSIIKLATDLREGAEEAVGGYDEIDTASLAYSYALAFLSEVDWYEIAEHAAADYPTIIASDDND